MQLDVFFDFPGGNIRLLSVDGDAVDLDRDLHVEDSDWFWWCFGVRGAAGRRIRVRLARDLVGACGPAVSLNRRDWAWAGEGSFVSRREFVYKVPNEASEIYFAFSFPYVLDDLERFLLQEKIAASVSRRTLTQTRQGREVPLLLFGNPGAANEILLTARHHCCEATANYVLEGLIEHMVEREAELCRECRFYCVPMVDLDGVQNGDQGKGRKPHDHGRDYGADPIYPETKAILERVAANADAVRAFLDFHSPWMWSEQDESLFFSCGPRRLDAHRERLSELLRERTRGGDLVYDGSLDVREGEKWNQGGGPLGKFHLPTVCPNLLLSTAFETTYCLAQGRIVTPDNLRAFGRAFGEALGTWLRETL